MSDTLPIPDFQTNPSESTSPQLQELNNLRDLRDKYTQLQILHQAVLDFVTGSPNSELKTKVENILLEESCKQVGVLDNEGFSQNSNLLGLPSSKNNELSYNEGLTLAKSVEQILQQKYKNIRDEFLKVTSEDVNSVPGRDTSQDKTLIELKGKLEEQQHKYINNLLSEQKILEDLAKLRLDYLPKVCKEKIKECQMEAHISELKTKIVSETTRIDVFMEQSYSLAAYMELLKDIKEQQLEFQSEIKHLKEMKEKYKQVDCKQFDDILKSYIQYETSLAKKKMLYENFRK
ncbi:uncharacterized protein LOC123015881 [Tribolium madens]|uniref:uncharacterized protein LOC123015881 n=1 Tax=Tribolium madens TaxID=41895 RepID=UPI001CF757A8|nr:uncharacterized protein LOC123015881 [Tribolium madens]